MMLRSTLSARLLAGALAALPALVPAQGLTRARRSTVGNAAAGRRSARAQRIRPPRVRQHAARGAHADRRQAVRRRDRRARHADPRASARAAGALPQGRRAVGRRAAATRRSRVFRGLLARLPRAARAAQQPRRALRAEGRATSSRATSSRSPLASVTRLRRRAREPRRRLCAARRRRNTSARSSSTSATRPRPASSSWCASCRRHRRTLIRPRSSRRIRCTSASHAVRRFRLAFAARRATPPTRRSTSTRRAGKIRVELYPDAAPKTVANFLDYVKAQALRRHAVPSRHPGLHDPGRRLHRRLQAEADACRRSRSSRSIAARRAVQRAGHHRDGAHRRPEFRDRRSSSSTSPTTSASTSAQPTPQGYGYTVFGKVVEGMDVVEQDRHSRPPAPGGPFPTDVPNERVIIKSAERRRRSNRRSDHGRSCTPITGDITLELDAENAPATVANFLQYVRDGHYDNTCSIA